MQENRKGKKEERKEEIDRTRGQLTIYLFKILFEQMTLYK